MTASISHPVLASARKGVAVGLTPAQSGPGPRASPVKKAALSITISMPRCPLCLLTTSSCTEMIAMKRIQLLGRLLVVVLLGCVPLAAGRAPSSAHAAASVTITLQMWSGPEGVAMRPIVARWNKEMGPKTGIHVVETEPSRDGYDALITSQLLSKSGTPDIVFPFNWDIPRVAKAGTLVDLTPYIKKNPSGFKMNDFFRVAVDAANLDGHQYALPLDMSLPILYYRKDLI